jgi:glucose-1-phosphate thymidylyltransferase
VGLRVVIPVAGAGTRLRPHTHTRPKVLLHVAGKPMIGHILEELRQYDVEEIALIVGPRMSEQIERYVESAFDFKFRYIVQPTPKGLGHAISLAAPGFRDAAGRLLIILGDTLFAADFGRIIGSPGNWIGVKAVEDPTRFGVIVLEGDRIVRMVEKPNNPPSNLAIVGIYLFDRPATLAECLDEVIERNVRDGGELQLTTALQMMLERGEVMHPFEIEEWFDCGKPETLLDTNRRLLERLDGAVPVFPGCIIRPPVAIDPGVRIERSIVGPHVTLARGCRVKDSIVRDSVISEGAEIDNALLESSIVGDNARVTGGSHALSVGDASEVRLG